MLELSCWRPATGNMLSETMVAGDGLLLSVTG